MDRWRIMKLERCTLSRWLTWMVWWRTGDWWKLFSIWMWETNLQVFMHVVVLVFLRSPKDSRDPFLIEAKGGFSFWRWNSPIRIGKDQGKTLWTGIVLFCLYFSSNRGQMFKKKLRVGKGQFIRSPIGAQCSNAEMPKEKKYRESQHWHGVELKYGSESWLAYVLHKKKSVSDGGPVACYSWELLSKKRKRRLKKKTCSHDPLPPSETGIWTNIVQWCMSEKLLCIGSWGVGNENEDEDGKCMLMQSYSPPLSRNSLAAAQRDILQPTLFWMTETV